MHKEGNSPKGKYLFATTDENYEDYSSGRVLYGVTGATNFPVRLSSELFQQCKDYLVEKENPGPYTLWDPFCGAGYSLTVLGLLHNSDIRMIFASDADETILATTKKNLSLLTSEGLNNRIVELKTHIENYGKNSHREALESANKLSQRIGKPIDTTCFQFNTLIETLPNFIKNIDIIITDLPYGQLTHWIGADGDNNLTQTFLNTIKISLNKKSVVALVSDKKQKITHAGFTKLKTFTLGKRKVWLLVPVF